MAETEKIAKMAELVSNDIFSVFGWHRRPHRDQNWKCVTKGHKKTTHPSDVVYSYQSPLEHGKTYLTIDLKSYKRATIVKSKIEEALISLAMSSDCANNSPDWHDLYADADSAFHVYGLLFIYNNDGAYDKDFGNLLADVKPNLVKVKARTRLFVFGPSDIQYLYTIANDIEKRRGRKELPDAEDCQFYHPDLVRARVTSNTLRAATAEMLLAPWLVLHYIPVGATADRNGYIVYYRGSGSSSDEWKFLIDYLFRFQLVGDSAIIDIRAPFADSKATAHFQTAKEQYAKDYFEFAEFKKRLDRIRMSSIQTVIPQFFQEELGMD